MKTKRSSGKLNEMLDQMAEQITETPAPESLISRSELLVKHRKELEQFFCPDMQEMKESIARATVILNQVGLPLLEEDSIKKIVNITKF